MIHELGWTVRPTAGRIVEAAGGGLFALEGIERHGKGSDHEDQVQAVIGTERERCQEKAGGNERTSVVEEDDEAKRSPPEQNTVGKSRQFG